MINKKKAKKIYKINSYISSLIAWIRIIYIKINRLYKENFGK
jgi:hypothetical protein